MIIFSNYFVILHIANQNTAMKTSILTLILLFFVCNTNAQFYTIGTVENPVKTTWNKTNNAPIEAATDSHSKDTILTIPDIKEFMAHYNSVSYPLRKVHITSPFGMRLHPIDKVYKLHNGLDLSAKNEEVYAMLDGVVESTGYNSTSGNYIILKHAAGLSVSYCHLRKNIKAKGDIVRAGDIVAVSGNTGKSTNYHLHFVVRKDGNYIDPILLIKYVDEVRKDIIRNYAQKTEG